MGEEDDPKQNDAALRAKSVKFADHADEPLVKRLGSGTNLSETRSLKSVKSQRTDTSTWLSRWRGAGRIRVSHG
jgi:hypothetical protein